MQIALFNDCTSAERLQKRLVQAGIQAEVHDEQRLSKLWFVSKPGCGARLEVPGNQFETAMQFLIAWDAGENVLSHAIHCPECRSLRVQYPQVARHSLLTNLSIGLAAELGFVERDYFCEDCHYTWPREGTQPSRSRPNSAPYYFIEGIAQPMPKLGAEDTTETKKAA